MTVLFSLICMLTIAGCQTMKQKPNTQYVDKYIPVYIVPSAPKVKQPVLAIKVLTDTQKNKLGELVKAYAISLHQEVCYAKQLREILDEYSKLSKSYPYIMEPNVYTVNLEDKPCYATL